MSWEEAFDKHIRHNPAANDHFQREAFRAGFVYRDCQLITSKEAEIAALKESRDSLAADVLAIKAKWFKRTAGSKINEYESRVIRLEIEAALAKVEK